jgi:hypothetical protein
MGHQVTFYMTVGVWVALNLSSVLLESQNEIPQDFICPASFIMDQWLFFRI